MIAAFTPRHLHRHCGPRHTTTICSHLHARYVYALGVLVLVTFTFHGYLAVTVTHFVRLRLRYTTNEFSHYTISGVTIHRPVIILRRLLSDVPAFVTIAYVTVYGTFPHVLVRCSALLLLRCRSTHTTPPHHHAHTTHTPTTRWCPRLRVVVYVYICRHYGILLPVAYTPCIPYRCLITLKFLLFIHVTFTFCYVVVRGYVCSVGHYTFVCYRGISFLR